MQAGRKLDVLVAEKVMGRTVDVIPFNSPWWAVPPYSTDIAAAWEVHTLACSWYFSKRRIYLDELERILRTHKFHVAWPDALLFLSPLNICLAALKAVGVDVNTHNSLREAEKL